MFIDRKDELKALNARYRSKDAEFIVIYGRRRIGKSELIEHFLRNKNGIRLLAREEAEVIQLKRFSERLATFFNDKFLAKTPFISWDSFLTYIIERSKKRFVLALDEFPYLVAENPTLPSIIQDYWDNRLRKTKLFLILCGSSISMMEKKVLGHKSPLYGRRTGQILLRPFTFKDVFNYLNKNIKESIEFYSTFGGTPAYITSIDKRKSLFENIVNCVLKTESSLYKDVEFLLREELREPRYYFSVLYSIAKGNTKLGEIINDTGLKRGIVGKYLSVLSDLQLIKREVPVTENILKSRMGVYLLQDNFFKFWFRYVYPNKEEIESNRQGEVIDKIKNTFTQYVSEIFEDVCKEALFWLMKKNKIFPFTKIGRWWYKDKEIDLVAMNERTKQVLFAECKWQDGVSVKKVLRGLKEKTTFFNWNKDKRIEYYAIFAKSFKKKIKEPNVFLFDLKDLAKILE